MNNPTNEQALSILTVPAFDDNYLWLVHNGQNAIVVDPGDATAILQALSQQGLRLSAILLTHHHSDHTGGVAELLTHYPIPVFGPAHDGIAAVTQPLDEGDKITIDALNLDFQVIAVPGHTFGHIAYYSENLASVFCGDTLFAGGCGRLFEGSPAQMLDSLDRLAKLPGQTSVYCAHEYTLSNLKFALEVEPDNLALQARMLREQEKRAENIPTVPSTIDLEVQTNPFLRSRVKAITSRLVDMGKVAAQQDDAANFAALREWKNNFR
ncbi:hydroxyacylglutathione hydrolase [Undibacterium fentianense]|uniref:Hydroxyacylglutathione hydrolase n=1 Tax=Undibacterium fentianense TaxID=2828728 RepID=A0A941DYU6_9BURK|nr:hydroxyacylglutathione hydrolase [Undibacterium fentianense]MBR7799280.1 hydroxyacylglutathione hydrolase [Undibacterium fentianense]